MLFSQRLKLGNEIDAWIRDNGAATCSSSTIAGLEVMGKRVVGPAFMEWVKVFLEDIIQQDSWDEWDVSDIKQSAVAILKDLKDIQQ